MGDEEDTTIGSFVEDDNTPGPAESTSNTMLAEALAEILGTLTQREADVLKMRFGMYDGRNHTLEEVGQIFGVTRERIRQIETKPSASSATRAEQRRSRTSTAEPNPAGTHSRCAFRRFFVRFPTRAFRRGKTERSGRRRILPGDYLYTSH